MPPTMYADVHSMTELPRHRDSTVPQYYNWIAEMHMHINNSFLLPVRSEIRIDRSLLSDE